MNKRRRARYLGVLVAVAAAVAASGLPCLAGAWNLKAVDSVWDEETGIMELYVMEMVNESDGIRVKSAHANYYKEAESFDFLESVRLTQNGTVLEAESGSFSRRTNAGSFRGSVSLVRSRTEEQTHEMELNCDELDLDVSTDSFTAKGNAVLRYINEDGEETVMWADRMDYDEQSRILKLTAVLNVSSPGLGEGSEVTADTIEFNVDTGDMRIKGLDLTLPALSDESEAES